jgi:hypothetical protein
MRKIFTVAAFALFGMLTASNLSAYSYDSWKFEPTVGPTIGVHNWGGHQFSMNLKVGKGDMWGGMVGFSFGGANSAQIKLAVVFDYPFYLTLDDRENDFAIGPTVDVGPKFGFGNVGSAVDFLNIGFGLRTAYRFTDKFGVVAELVHFSMSFVQWVSGAGTSGNFAMAYDMRLGVFLMF